MQTLRISAISYLNTVPFIYGLRHSGFLENYHIDIDVPSSCARKLQTDQTDVGIVPVAMIPHIPGAQMLTDYCIAADGPVDTVILASQVPLADIHTIWLDQDSRSSVNLIRILALKYWKRDFHYAPLPKDYLLDMQPGIAAVLIGDKTFEAVTRIPYIYDLSMEWKKVTGLPFVFACWVANKVIPEPLLGQFRSAIRFGVDHILEAIDHLDKSNYENVDIVKYLTRTIDYRLDERKKEGMDLFLRCLSETSPAS